MVADPALSLALEPGLVFDPANSSARAGPLELLAFDLTKKHPVHVFLAMIADLTVSKVDAHDWKSNAEGPEGTRTDVGRLWAVRVVSDRQKARLGNVSCGIAETMGIVVAVLMKVGLDDNE